MGSDKVLEEENKRLKEELMKWKKAASKGEIRPCRDEHLLNILDYSDAPSRTYCQDHPFDPRCVKSFSKDPATNRLKTVLDVDSPYYDEKSAKCLFGATGIDYVAEGKLKKKKQEEKK